MGLTQTAINVNLPACRGFETCSIMLEGEPACRMTMSGMDWRLQGHADQHTSVLLTTCRPCTGGPGPDCPCLTLERRPPPQPTQLRLFGNQGHRPLHDLLKDSVSARLQAVADCLRSLPAGKMQHQDSCGNKGTIGPGGVQWLTAGRGLIHSEMPVVDGGECSAGPCQPCVGVKS